MQEVSLLIGGVTRGASGGRTFDRINPANGQPASRAAAATVEDADAAVAAAVRAFPAWAALAPTERRKRLLKAADLMDARTPEFIATGVAETGAIMQPTIVDGITSAMKLYAEESFGPVVTVQRVEGDEEAIRIANDSEYGLSSAVFSRNVSRALNVAKRIESGICHINGPTVHDEAQITFGGVKKSGYGRFGSTASIVEFTDLRWITIQTGPRHYPV